ncbi:MAG: 16S rRNA (cytosine(1402)-N(4))-methyltransferase RsmH [Bacillota bacterium]
MRGDKSFYHEPVMPAEVLEALAVKPGGVYVDCTVGGGGHARGILERSAPDGVLLGLDRDPEAIAAAGARLKPFGGRVILVQADFRDVARVAAGLGIAAADGVLYDLGVSSHQFDAPARGFTYREDAPLDMRMDPTGGVTAADLVNTLPQDELARIIRQYGEERWAGRIAAFIVDERKRRPVRTTGQLVEIIKRAVPAGARRQGPHPARRTFQALRIAVNTELDALAASLRQAVDLLRPGGRLCVIAYHSLEDRIVKETLREMAATCVCPPGLPVCRCGRRPQLRVLSGRAQRPSPAEVAANPRSRSARLRAAEKLASVLREREGE